MFEISDGNNAEYDIDPKDFDADDGLLRHGEGVTASGSGGNDVDDDPEEGFAMTTTDASGATVMMRVRGDGEIVYLDRLDKGHIDVPNRHTLFFGSVGHLTIGGRGREPDAQDETLDPEDS